MSDEARELVSPEFLEDVTRRLSPEQSSLPEHDPESGVATALEPILSKLEERGVAVVGQKRMEKPGTGYVLEPCPFYPDKHHDRASTLIAWDDGNIAFLCLGERCREEDNRILNLLNLLGLRAVAVKRGKLTVMRAVDVAPREIRTTWDGRIVLHDLNAVVGREKVGKGLLLKRLVADLTTGKLTGQAETVLYVSAEEVLEAYQRPYIEAAGADLERVLLMPMGSFGLPDGIGDLVHVLREYGSRFAFFDPINKHLADDRDPDGKRDVAMTLGALALAASEHEFTPIGSLHLGRGKEGLTAEDAWAHSMEWKRAIRSAVLIGRVEDDGKAERTVVHQFSNYGREANAIKATIDQRGEQATLLLGAEDPFIEADDLFWKPKASDCSKRRECAEQIQGRWEDLGRPATATSDQFSSIAHAFDNKTMQRARDQLGISVETDSTGQRGIRNTWRFGGHG